MKILGFYCIGHDANMCAWDSDGDRWAVIELERLFGIRHFHLDTHDPNEFRRVATLCLQTLERQFGIGGNFDLLCLPQPQYANTHYPLDGWVRYRDLEFFGHQWAHARTAFHQSGFSQAIVACVHGGGDDGFFNVYRATEEGSLTLIHQAPLNLGRYSRVARHIHLLKETRQPLSLPGKAMGLAAFGEPRPGWMDPIREFYLCASESRSFAELMPEACLPLSSEDLAATNQAVFEELLVAELGPVLTRFPELPLCLSGGCALNITANELLLRHFGRRTFVPPNPNDGGLAAGYVLQSAKPRNPVHLAFAGLPLIGSRSLPTSFADGNSFAAGAQEVATALAKGLVVGVCHGPSECGPRALGNRSILANPSICGMKDRLNSRVKHREAFRPFAGCVRSQDVDVYFDGAGPLANYEFMSFGPKVKQAWIEALEALRHPDGTCRIQAVRPDVSPFLHDVLTEFQRLTGIGVLLNTSLNTRGHPIVASMAGALEIFKNHNLDALYCEGLLFTGAGG